MDLVTALEALLGLEGVCQVWLESPETICTAPTTQWWCSYHYHDDDGVTSDDYAGGPTPAAAVQAAYDDQRARVHGRTKGAT